MIKQLFITVISLLCSLVSFSQTYATSVTSCNSSGACLGGSSCTNTGNVVDGNLTNFGTMSTGIGVACTRSLIVGFPSTMPSGSYVGFYIDDHNLVALLSNISITTYNGVTPVETASGGSLLSVLTGGVGTVYFKTSAGSYDGVSLSLSATGVAQTVDIYYAYSSSFLLPLTFTSFNYQRNGNSLLLQWTTANEINNQYFSVEKSLNGYGFTTLGKVDASGSGSGLYRFSDPTPENGPAFYRLKKVDRDGRFAYSTVIVVKPGNPDVAAWVYPNPIDDMVQINVYSNTTALVKTEIIDLSGKTRVKRENVPVNAGGNIIPLDTKWLAPGIYVLRITDAGRAINSTCKIIKK